MTNDYLTDPDGFPPLDSVDAAEIITEIGDADLPPHLRSGPVYSAICKGDPQGLVEQFKAYCSANRILYYARPKESFFISEAYDMARLAGCDKLLLEDMS